MRHDRDGKGLRYRPPLGDALVFEETPAYVDDVDTFYDLAAVRAAKARAEVLAKEGDEMEEIQQRIQDLLGRGESKK